MRTGGKLIMIGKAAGRTRMRREILAILAFLATLCVLVTACQSEEIHTDVTKSVTIKVLAGSEIKNLQAILNEMTEATGVKLEFEYKGTLEGTEALLSSDKRPWQAAWFPSNRYLTLFPQGADIVKSSTSIMRSPVVLGLKGEAARRLGWDGEKQPTWQEVVDAVEQGKLRYGMTSPISSNSGFTTLVQMTTALAGTGSVLTAENIRVTTSKLTQFASGQQLASGSSGWLADKFTKQPDDVDGIFNYESILKTLTVKGKPLRIVTPSDGVVTSDYPLTLLKGADEGTAASFKKATDYLMRKDVQKRIADQTHSRTTATAPETKTKVFELPFPNRLETVHTLLRTWLSQVKKPSNMVFAIDTSGSMRFDDRMDNLRDALAVLSSTQSSESSGALLALQPRETITYLEFSHEVKSQFTVQIPTDPVGYRTL